MNIDKKGVKIVLVACSNTDGIIGVGDQLPWKFPKEMAYFREKTLGHVVLMGSSTARGFPPLKKRTSLVLTSKTGEFEEPYHVVHSFQDAVDWCVANNRTTIMVIGGGYVYAEAIHYADEVLLNVVQDLHIPWTQESRVIGFPTHELFQRTHSTLPQHQPNFQFNEHEFPDIIDTDQLTGKEHKIRVCRFH